MADDALYQFCGSEFWNYNLTWYTDSPRLTSCFDETVLVWVPCSVLAVLLPFDVYTSSQSRSRNIPWNWRSLLKLVFCSINLVSSVLDILAPLKGYFQGQTIYPVQFFTPFLRILSTGSCISLIQFHRLKGVRTSGTLFFFWLFVVVCGLSQTSSIFRNWDEEMSFHDVNFLVYYFTSFAVFALQFPADIEPLETDDAKVEKPCPEFQSSFITRLTFGWFDSLAYLGFKRPLVVSDLWSLRHEETTACVFPTINKYWEETLLKSYKKTAGHAGNGVGPKSTSSRKGKPASILPALVKTFWPIYLFASILKIVADVTNFINPQVLKLMIAFIGSDDPVWKGYLYAFLMFIVAAIQMFFQHQSFYYLLMVGRRQRSAVISLIYRKALRLSNFARRENTLGEIVNLMAVDAQRFFDVTTQLMVVWSAPLQIALAMYFLWQNLGPSVLAGLALMVLMIPINGVIANKMKKLQVKQMKNKDQRAKLMNEILNGIKVLKLYAWEPSFEQQVHKIRDKEVKVLRESAYFGAATSFLWSCTPFLVTLVTFAVYVLSDENNVLDASKAFVSLSLFNLIRMPISFFPMMVTSVIQTKVSLDRINKFMNSEELDPDAVSHDEKEEDPIIVENGSFKWEPEGELILKNINLRVKSNSLVAIVGTVGCGKSSLVGALLGEMEKMSGRVNVKGRVSYVPQSAWILNNTLQDNITFGQEYHRRTYQQVIEACALKADFEMLPMGDQTEIGEKGINLSGGQKQRVSLARALYCDADIYYLDDPLSAVDSHVGKHIFENVIGSSGLLRHKTRIFITHSITYLHDVDLVVVLKDGGISEIGTFQELLDKEGEFADFLHKHLQDVDPEELEELDENIRNKLMDRQLSTISEISVLSRKPSKGSLSKGSQKSLNEIPLNVRRKNQLIQEEKAQVGGVKLSVYKEYFKAAGPFLVLLSLLMTCANQGLGVGSNIWLSIWSSDTTLVVNGTQDTSKRDLYLGVYAALGFSQIGGTVVTNLAMAMGGIQAAVGIHAFLLTRIFHAPVAFFDVTPTGRILSRCGKDTEVIDNSIANVLNMALSRLVAVIGTLAVICFSSPTFIIVMVPVGCVYYFILRIHIATSRQLKRLESVTRSPIYSHFGETVQGTSVLRAFNVQDRFIKESEHKVDLNQVCSYPNMISNRWLGVRLEIIGDVIVFSTAILAVVGRDALSAGLVGLSLSYAMQITQALNWMVRMTADVETNIVAVERIIEYNEAPQEAAWEITPNIAQNDWPKEGRVEFKDYDVRYREGLDLVLKGISFSIKGGEKVGIVGRTGAGKSSMTLSLFRIIEAAGGCIQIDGVTISELGLHALRSRLTIIPQDPVLFSGTLRSNLDPFEKYTDDQVWEALELSHLKSFVSGLPTRLQHEVSEGGENLSLGQRQLICLARALLRKTKVLVLDEATAAVDLETDDLIQKTIRSEFASCTVLTIAHRINTIMDSDRVLVLDQGTVVEFDPPALLLQRKSSIFYGMAKDAGLVS